MSVPSFGLFTAPSAFFRPLIVAIAHIPILVVACSTIPVWIMAVVRPPTHGEFGLKVLRELRTWSHTVISASGGTPQQ